MENKKVTVALNQIEAATVATEAMKKEEEKKMNKPAEKVTDTRKALMSNARKAARALDAARANKDAIAWAKGMDAAEALNNAIAALNEDVLTEVYAAALNDPAPVAALCKALTYPRWYAKTNKKDNVTILESRATRLNVLDFLRYTEEKDKGVKDAEKIKTAIAAAARSVADYVLASITGDGASIRATLPTLEKLFAALSLGIHANGKDVRFIAYAATRARGLGELAEITERSIVPYIMDVVSIRTRGVEYKFEEKKEEAKA